MQSSSFFKHHVFFCLNQRDNGTSCCAQSGAKQAFNYCKEAVKKSGCSGPGGIRVNKAGCLDRCDAGPVMVVYPEGIWYTYVDQNDLDEIIDSHLKNNVPVERLIVRTK